MRPSHWFLFCSKHIVSYPVSSLFAALKTAMIRGREMRGELYTLPCQHINRRQFILYFVNISTEDSLFWREGILPPQDTVTRQINSQTNIPPEPWRLLRQCCPGAPWRKEGSPWGREYIRKFFHIIHPTLAVGGMKENPYKFQFHNNKKLTLNRWHWRHWLQ